MTDEILKRISQLEERVNKLENVSQADRAEQPSADKQKTLSIKEFMLTKNVDNDVKKTLLIAYYIEEVTKSPSFNVEDLEKTYRLAKDPSPTNLNDKINKNIAKGFLMEATEKKDKKKAWELTTLGKKFVEEGLK